MGCLASYTVSALHLSAASDPQLAHVHGCHTLYGQPGRQGQSSIANNWRCFKLSQVFIQLCPSYRSILQFTTFFYMPLLFNLLTHAHYQSACGREQAVCMMRSAIANTTARMLALPVWSYTRNKASSSIHVWRRWNNANGSQQNVSTRCA